MERCKNVRKISNEDEALNLEDEHSLNESNMKSILHEDRKNHVAKHVNFILWRQSTHDVRKGISSIRICTNHYLSGGPGRITQ